MSRGVCILKLLWNDIPKMPPGYAVIWPLFTIQIGDQALVDQHWPTIQKRLQERHETLPDNATNAQHEALAVKAGNRVAFYTDGSIEVFR